MLAILSTHPDSPRGAVPASLDADLPSMHSNVSLSGIDWFQVRGTVFYARWLDAIAIAVANAVGSSPSMTLIDLGTTTRPLVGLEIASADKSRVYSINVALTKETALFGVPGARELDVALPRPVALLGFTRDLAARINADIAKSAISI